ncbi:anti-sigma-W factor RsiW [Oceanobacillus massiliensis]|uniref:anti-sigma-W factor RsiW n=1 Tax=Oceanobacillus massiliensis TaxID=1465765 RepID=UPI000289BB9F|nr:anti-sigma-W factor RsiW [Oceanobacillus massiliensis]
MSCNKETIELMHKYLDGDLTKAQEAVLGSHLEGCEDCQAHFHELKRTITLIKSAENFAAPEDFTQKVMMKLPTEKKRLKYTRWFKLHPVITAAAIFFIFMMSGMVTSWSQDTELVVSKQKELIVEGDTVIVPEGVTVPGDVLVKNGNLIIEGTIDGDVTLVNGELIHESPLDGEGLMASAGGVNGELEKVDQMFEWMWYKVKSLFKGIFSF